MKKMEKQNNAGPGPEFTYISGGRYHRYDEFTLFAEVISETADTVIYHRVMNFGKVDCGTVAAPRKLFEQYYKKRSK